MFTILTLSLLACCHNLPTVANYEYLGNQPKKGLENEFMAKLFIITIQYWLYLTSFTKKASKFLTK